MIFATVGTQLPFPRFIQALDGIAGRHQLRVVAQTCGENAGSSHLEMHNHLDPVAFDKFVQQAQVIVGHAGIGTVLSAGRAEKPVILYPRLASLGEHRNEHQLATVSSLSDREGIYVARSDEELEAYLMRSDLTPFRLGDDGRRQPLIESIRSFILA